MMGTVRAQQLRISLFSGHLRTKQRIKDPMRVRTSILITYVFTVTYSYYRIDSLLAEVQRSNGLSL